MSREVLIVLTVLSLAGCAVTHTRDTRLDGAGEQIDPGWRRPDLSDDVTGGIQTRELTPPIPDGR